MSNQVLMALVEYNGVEYTAKMTFDFKCSSDYAKECAFQLMEDENGIELPRDLDVTWVTLSQ